MCCFGVNDSGLEAGGILKYKEALAKVFDEIKNAGAEIIFMTPSLKTDRVDIIMKDAFHKIAEETVENERSGWLSKYIDEARKICEEKNVPVCDCYKKWLILKENNVNINDLLSNRINHPIEKMHWLFAYELVTTMFEK